MSLNELAANQQQCSVIFLPIINSQMILPRAGRNRLGKKEEGQGNQEQIAFKKSYISSNCKEVFPTNTIFSHHFI